MPTARIVLSRPSEHNDLYLPLLYSIRIWVHSQGRARLNRARPWYPIDSILDTGSSLLGQRKPQRGLLAIRRSAAHSPCFYLRHSVCNRPQNRLNLLRRLEDLSQFWLQNHYQASFRYAFSKAIGTSLSVIKMVFWKQFILNLILAILNHIGSLYSLFALSWLQIGH